MAVIRIRKGSDRAVHVPISEVTTGWTATAEVREYPGQTTPVQSWSSRTNTAVIAAGEVILLCNRNAYWSWHRGELTVSLTAPDGTHDIAGPWRVVLS